MKPTPKQEAEDLILKYYPNCSGGTNLIIGQENAKKCAIIDVQNTIDLLYEIYSDKDVDSLAEVVVLNKICELESIKNELEKM